MTILTTPDTLHVLDWVPACEVENCLFGHPPATHIGIPPCPDSILMCTGSADIARLKLMQIDTLVCARCDAIIDASEIRIEPLP